ncbi:MAG: protein-L-isoaspartate O-methyltransferase family protein [Steroidobacteraceae bacterium]
MTRAQAAIDQMVSQQVRTWEVLDARTLEAMQRVPREAFVAPAWRSLACAESALPLPKGKHMLTPMLVGRILQALGIRQGEQVLEIGTGSGYLSACLAALGGRVQSLELHGEIAAFARANLHSAGLGDVEVTTADGAALFSETAYDAIVLTASLPIYDARFERALKYGGRLFAIVGTGPIMEARLVRRLGASEFSVHVLFETCVEALENVPVPPLFRF